MLADRNGAKGPFWKELGWQVGIWVMTIAMFELQGV